MRQLFAALLGIALGCSSGDTVDVAIVVNDGGNGGSGGERSDAGPGPSETGNACASDVDGGLIDCDDGGKKP